MRQFSTGPINKAVQFRK